MAVNYKKIVTIGGLGNFKTRQDVLNESKFIKRTDINVDNNYIANVTVTHADDPANDEVVQLLTPQSAISAGNINGVLSINNIPASALERVVIVADDAARFALTGGENGNVQLGDVVKVIRSGEDQVTKVFMVKDESNLNNEAGYEEFQVGSAASVPWSGVQNPPETYAPSDHASSKVTSMAGYGDTLDALEITMDSRVSSAEAKEPEQRTEAEQNALDGKAVIEDVDTLNMAMSKVTWMLDQCLRRNDAASAVEDMFATNAEIDEGVFNIVASNGSNDDPTDPDNQEP